MTRQTRPRQPPTAPQHRQARDCISRLLASASRQPPVLHPPGQAGARGEGAGAQPPPPARKAAGSCGMKGPWIKLRQLMTALPEPGDAPGVIKQGRAQAHQGNGIKSVFKGASFIPLRRRGGPGRPRNCGFLGHPPLFTSHHTLLHACQILQQRRERVPGDPWWDPRPGQGDRDRGAAPGVERGKGGDPAGDPLPSPREGVRGM